ncbi:unnamed protein product [Chironomus riparius]|uniref:Ionotropic receptor n=1 Tax=Chironomus riparius TaxID=315576 RepID=A0A9N9RZQ2_9DIPT|nr:unnamed protein product [Chironomus riparius]
MIFVRIFVITVFLNLVKLSTSNDYLSISKAIADICEVFYIQNSITFDVIIYGESTRHLDDVINGVLGLIGGNASKSVVHFKNIRFFKPDLIQSAVILFKNISILQDFNANTELTNPSYKTLKFLIYCENLDDFYQIPTVKMYNSDRSHVSSFQYFIVDREFFIFFVTFDHFQEKSCNLRSHRIINSFTKKSQKWTKKLGNFRNFNDFNGCMLTYTDSYNANYLLNRYNKEILSCARSESKLNVCPKLIKKILDRPGVKFEGLVYEVFEAMAKHGNFSTKYNFITNGFLTTKGNYFIKHDIRIYSTGYFPDLIRRVHMISPFYDVPSGIFVTPPEFYNNFEKLLLPFDAVTWILLVATFITISIVLFNMRFTSNKVRKFVFGLGIQTPGLNVLRIFFGIGQTKLPKESILRFILIFFVLFCLIMRTCYQSKMFDFITSDMRKSPPKTLDEVIDMGYTIVLGNGSEMYDVWYNDIRSRNAKSKFLFFGESVNISKNYCVSINRVHPKLAYLMPIMNMLSASSFCGGFLTSVKHFEMTSCLGGLGMVRNSILYPIFDKVMNKLVPSGIPLYLFKYYKEFLYGVYQESKENMPKILTFDDLEFGFIMWLTACGISLAAFATEILRYKTLKFIEIYVGLIVLVSIVTNRTRNN